MVPAVTATGLEKSSSCHPDAVSLLNVPAGQQRPRGGPQTADLGAGVIGLLVEPDPGDEPAAGRLELHPQRYALVSAVSDAPVGVPSCQILHGHEPTAPVVKLHENGLLIGVPEAFCAPDTVAV